jgi:hypothetical protein
MIIETFGRNPLAFGLDRVDSHLQPRNQNIVATKISDNATAIQSSAIIYILTSVAFIFLIAPGSGWNMRPVGRAPINLKPSAY